MDAVPEPLIHSQAEFTVMPKRCLLVVAHPLDQSLGQSLARSTRADLEAQGHEVTCLDLYAEQFDARLSADERLAYSEDQYAPEALQAHIEQLRQAEALVLVFPTWWFGFPAILKGWFDRVWGPGVAFDHASDLGSIQPCLHNLQEVLAITTLGSTRWVDWLVMRRPVKRILKTALVGVCAPKARFQMCSLYESGTATEEKVSRFMGQIQSCIRRWTR